ncbi:signal peptidase I [Aerococcaceae bacterium INB8]|uniref:Signal peptidase I n=1 Tax=Ruoffia halotolerans TaxID=2748684 RepID=A0A839A4K0_9LACT|nr:signal peptidase I [Ruoffia halotolerans]MBA5728750.1 signal peptidase I [Ruoffia halotolerans]
MSLIKYLINELVSIIFAVLVAVLIFLALRHYVLQPFQVEGNSMEPQLHNQDQMVMLRNKDIKRYDVVVFPDPRGSGDSYVKRIIGEPGDEIYFSNDTLYLNNQPVEEPYLEPLKSETVGKFTEDFSLWDTLGLTEVPEDYYFVMGDNRPYSGDSRQFGLIQAEDIQGVTNFVYFPFERFGKIEEYNLTEDGTVNILE